MTDQKSKKRKREVVIHQNEDHVDTSKPSAVFKPTKGRRHTLSIALPGSVIANALTHELKTLLASQIARAAAVFCVDEIVIFDDGQCQKRPFEENGYSAFSDPNHFLNHVLSYLETPPHLRRVLFPMHPDLRTAGATSSLDMPHHLRSNEWCRYREGVTMPPSSSNGPTNKRPKSGSAPESSETTLVNCGLDTPIMIPVALAPDTRVTVKLASETRPRSFGTSSSEPADVVSPNAPREEAGYYWGYATRQASSLSAVFTECPYDGGYDISIGTSERGIAVSGVLDSASEHCIAPTWNHLLLVFGGVAGLEVALAADQELQAAGVKEASEVFDRWVNLMPAQGSRTIRTEEAVWVGLMGLRPLVDARGRI